MMERKQHLRSDAPEALRRKIFQEIRDLDERVSAEEIDLLERKQVMEEMLREREWRSTDVEEGKDTVIVWRWGHSDIGSWVSKLKNGG